jgi:hypothetical protein
MSKATTAAHMRLAVVAGRGCSRIDHRAIVRALGTEPVGRVPGRR